jgi:hypothetical protein
MDASDPDQAQRERESPGGKAYPASRLRSSRESRSAHYHSTPWAVVLLACVVLGCLGKHGVDPEPYGVRIVQSEVDLDTGCSEIRGVSGVDGRTGSRSYGYAGNRDVALERLLLSVVLARSNTVVIEHEAEQVPLDGAIGGAVAIFGTAYRCARDAPPLVR